jgi:hypothetical protein
MIDERFPILVKQLIPDESTRKSLSSLQSSQRTWKSAGWGRITNDITKEASLAFGKVDSSFWDLIYSCAKTHFGDSAIPSYWKWCRYSPTYGIPNIPPHIDINACTYTIDLQLDGNIEWEIFIEGKPYMMENGDALLYLGSDQFHWRPKCPTSDRKSFLEMCFIHFVEPSHWYHTNGQHWIDSDEVRLPWRKRMLELLPKYKSDTYQPFEDPEDFPGY